MKKTAPLQSRPVPKPRPSVLLCCSYALGVLAGATRLGVLVSPIILFFLVYFAFSAPFLLEGTKRFFSTEHPLAPLARRRLGWSIAISNLPWLAVMVLLGFIQPLILIALAVFLFLVLFTDAPPLRASSRPILGPLFSALFIFPAFFGYRLAGGIPLEGPAFAAVILGVIALSAFRSTITPIETPSWISLRGILFFSFLLFLSATALSLPYFRQTGALIGLAYSGIAAISLWITRPRYFHHRALPLEERVAELYGWLRYINVLAVLEIFLTILKRRFGG